MRHLSSNNQIQSLLSLEHDFNEPHLQAAFHYVQHDLDERLQDPAYRNELSRIGFIDPQQHPEMKVCNWFDQMGTFVKNGMVGERAFFELFGRLVDRTGNCCRRRSRCCGASAVRVSTRTSSIYLALSPLGEETPRRNLSVGRSASQSRRRVECGRRERARAAAQCGASLSAEPSATP